MKLSLSFTVYITVCFLSFFPFAQAAQELNTSLEPQEPQQQEGFDWSPYKKTWEDDIQFHGFFSQGLFHSTGNNVYGKSKNSVSAGLTELGLNVSYQALRKDRKSVV